MGLESSTGFLRPGSGRTAERLPLGFTLIEVLVSIFIGVIVLSVLYASFFQIIRAKDRAEEELEFFHEARAILSQLREDMAMTYIRGLVSPNSTGSIPYFFIGKLEEQHSSISFTSFSHEQGVDSKSPDQVEISYYLEPVPETDLFFLIKREDPNITLEDSESEEKNSGGIQYIMSERVVEFKLEYMTQIEDEFTDDFAEEEWDSTQTNSLPKIVKVTLIMRSPRGEDVLFNSLILIPLAN